MGDGHGWWRSPDAVHKHLEFLYEGGEVELVPCAEEASQTHTLEAVMGFQMRKAHLDLFALPPGSIEGLCTGE